MFVNSGSSANMLALLCAGIGPGSHVITPACTFSTTVAPLVPIGAVPVFIDIDAVAVAKDIGDNARVPFSSCFHRFAGDSH